MARNLSNWVKEALEEAKSKTPITTSLRIRDADVASISPVISAVAAGIGQLGISAEEATKAFQSLAELLGGSSARNVTITRRKSKNRDSARIEGKDIHGGHVSISPSGVKTFEILVNIEDKFLLCPFQVGDRVIVSGKFVKEALHLQVVDRKIQTGDACLLYLEDRFRSHLVQYPETEEENLDILHELSQ